VQPKTIYLQHNKHNMHLFEQLVSTLAPHRCISCGREGTPLCLPCTRHLPYAPECCYKCGQPAQKGLCMACRADSNLQTITVRTLHVAIAARAVHNLKFERNRSISLAIGQSLAEICPAGLITHIPTANRRIRQRGYDQAKLLARELAAATSQPYKSLLLRHGTQRQLGRNRAVRRRQLIAAFQALAAPVPPATPIILVDDVLTTGSTFEVAAATLRRAGYTTIHAIAFTWAESAQDSER
jgi:predicted amidophosphoribosyltransferase